MNQHKVSLLKAVSWRFLGSLITGIIVLVLTHKWQVSLFVSGAEVVSKIAAYYFHERIWTFILKRFV